jgi:hypothetical protein
MRRHVGWLDAVLAGIAVSSGDPGARGSGECEMKTLVEMIVKALVDKPEEVRITEIKGNHAHVIELSGKENKRYILEIIEN